MNERPRQVIDAVIVDERRETRAQSTLPEDEIAEHTRRIVGAGRRVADSIDGFLDAMRAISGGDRGPPIPR